MKTKENKFRKRLKESIVHLFGGIVVEEIPSTATIGPAAIDPMESNYLFDFKAGYRSNWNERNGVISGGVWDSSGNSDKKPTKIVIKPIDVVNELQSAPTFSGVAYLDEKIAVLRDKAELIQQHYAKQEVEALIERLENRKRYAEFKTFFDQFAVTTDEKITELLGKYELQMHSSDIFIPEFPDEAIKLMKDCTKKITELTKKKPVYYVIAQPDQFRKADEKRDPILLVQSPFGFYYHILGAWDQEMLILSSL